MSDTRPGDLLVFNRTWIRVIVALPVRTWGTAISVPLVGGEADVHPCMCAGAEINPQRELLVRFE